jgi:hypothetical protein
MSRNTSRAYAGPERRRRCVYATKNSEYHCRDGVCIAVRDRQSRKFLRLHAAIGRRAFALGGAGEGRVGFGVGEGESPARVLFTSPILSVERPPRETLAAYESVHAPSSRHWKCPGSR